MTKHYRLVLRRRWDSWILPLRYGVLLTFLRLNITKVTFWNIFSGLCIKFRNKTWRPIRYLWQNITNLQMSTFHANVTPGMCNKGILHVLGHKLSFKTLVDAKINWTNVFSGPKTSKMQLSSCDTGVQKFNEWKSQNSILSLLMAIFIVRN